ncbi:alkaline phosphatase family protein [Limisalsivibrio acetivorans]|uniref:alkaline phosphatase family protein n=1 Tax=Limisalsivibrio acetivorans TaxID=1304888 RepID=UPI0003B30218|nr:alkaline phosphatase family protein [Limisalsivibrio acetivorans]
MKTGIHLLLFLIAQLLFAEPHPVNTVAVISIDALHPAAVSEENSPNIYGFIKEGRYSSEASSTQPPKTLIAHTAMLSGLSPEENGKTDNTWKKGEDRVSEPTMLSTAKQAGYETALIYSKPKLGYLANEHTDTEIYSKFNAIEKAVKTLDINKKQFIFLHISGLDFAGPESGWLSDDYLDEFNFIDEMLAMFFNKLSKGSSYLLVITSDHAGHGKIHGSKHPEDAKRPLIVYSNSGHPPELTPDTLKISNLKQYIESIYIR